MKIDPKLIIEVTKTHIRNTDRTEDEAIQMYLKGMQDTLQLLEKRL